MLIKPRHRFLPRLFPRFVVNAVAMLFIIAGKEELFDNRDHGIKAHERAKGPKKLITIPNITPYLSRRMFAVFSQRTK